MFLLAGLTATLLFKSSAATRHLVWAVALLAFALLPILSQTIPKWRVLPGWLGTGDSTSRFEGSGARSSHGLASANPTEDGARDPSRRIVDSRAALRTDSTEALAASSPIHPMIASWSWDSLRPSRLLVVVWLIGLGLLLLRIARSWFGLRRLRLSAVAIESGPIDDVVRNACRQLGIEHPVNVYVSSRRVTPMTWGLLHTYLLFPAEASGWEQRRLRSVALHELAHVKRCDTITRLLTHLICTFYWFHPCAWLAARRLRIEAERACDDLVLRSDVRASDYAEDLLNILVQRPIPCSALAIAGQSELEGRIRAILDEGVDRRSITTGLLVLALAVGLCCTTAFAALRAPTRPATEPAGPPPAQPKSLASQPPRRIVPKVTVICVDEKGQPVPGAELHLYQLNAGEKGRFVDSGTFTSDTLGRAICAEAMFSNELGNFDRWIYARVPGRLVGVARTAKWTNQRVINPEFRVVLQPSRSVEGQVTVPAGFDPTKVVVRVRTLQVSTGPAAMDYEGFPRESRFADLDTALPERFECRPDAQGRIRFEDVPVRGRLYLVTAGDGLGEAQWMNDSPTFDQPVRLTIGEESVLSGRVLTPDGMPAIGMKVTARLSSFGRRRNAYLSSFRAMTDGAGTFAIHGLPQTEFTLSVEDPKKLLTFRPIEDLLVPPRQDPKLTLEMEPGTRVSGRVLDPDGRPVEGAAFSALTDSREGSDLCHDMTDANGRYEFRLPAGSARLYFNALPEGFAYPDPQVVKRLDIKRGQADIQGLDFTLQRRSERRREPRSTGAGRT